MLGVTIPLSLFANWCGRVETGPRTAKLVANGPTAVNRCAVTYAPVAGANFTPNQ